MCLVTDTMLPFFSGESLPDLGIQFSCYYTAFVDIIPDRDDITRKGKGNIVTVTK